MPASPNSSPRILITRPQEQADEIVAALTQRGAIVDVIATIRIEFTPWTDEMLETLRQHPPGEWLVFTSTNCVKGLTLAGFWPQGPVAAVGPKTQSFLTSIGHPPDLVGDKNDGRGLAQALVNRGGRHALIVRGDLANVELPSILECAGWTLRHLVVYRNVPAEIDGPELERKLKNGEYDWVTFTSGSAFTNLVRALQNPSALSSARIASIGPRTSEVIKAAQFCVSAEAKRPTVNDLAEAIFDAQ